MSPRISKQTNKQDKKHKEIKPSLISPSESTMAEQEAMEAKHLLAKYHFSPS